MIEKKLRKYIVPNVMAMLGMSCYVLADTFFIARASGANGLTALNLVLPLYNLVYAIGAMIGIGYATRYTLDKSLNRKDVDDYFSNAVLWLIFFSIPFVIAGLVCPEFVLKLLGADSVILAIGIEYLKTQLLFTPFFMLNYAITGFVRNDGAPKVAMAATLISCLFNIVFDYIFMFPMNMGMKGAALATGIAPVVSICVCMKHFLSKKNTLKFKVCKIPFDRLCQSASLGVVAFVSEISVGITTMVFNFILLRLSSNMAVAAYGIVANLAIVGTSLFNGVSQGLQPLASRYAADKDKTKKIKIYRHSRNIGIVIALLLVAGAWIFDEQLVAIFNKESVEELARIATVGLKLYFLGFIVASINLVKSGYYSAIGRAGISSIISICRGVVAIVIFALVLSKMFGIIGVWISFPVAEIFTLIVAFVCESINKKREI